MTGDGYDIASSNDMDPFVGDESVEPHSFTQVFRGFVGHVFYGGVFRCAPVQKRLKGQGRP